MAETMLEMRGVRKTFKTTRVLDGVDLAVQAGSVLGLLGKNGAGKTTLLKCALGLQHPQQGAALVFGENANNLSAAVKAQLGYVPQQVRFWPWMKIKQLIAYTGAFYPQLNDV